MTPTANRKVGIVGASGYVGEEVVRLTRTAGLTPIAISRSKRPSSPELEWATLDSIGNDIPLWIDVGPIASFTERKDAVAAKGAEKYIAISSTSLLTKASSPSSDDREMTKRLERSERAIEDWGRTNGIEWVILRPTVIYGLGKDRNICEIAAMIRRFGFFPIFGKAAGKRQPIHATDLATACLQAALSPSAHGAYNVAGAEVLTYREMVRRIFQALDRRPIMPTVPMPLFRAALAALNRLPRYRNWTPEMAERMNKDMAFSNDEAVRDFGFQPRPFDLSATDLPS